MMLAVSAELDREMEGRRDGGEDEIFMRSSCWGEAGLQSAAAAAASQQLTDNKPEA